MGVEPGVRRAETPSLRQAALTRRAPPGAPQGGGRPMRGRHIGAAARCASVTSCGWARSPWPPVASAALQATLSGMISRDDGSRREWWRMGGPRPPRHRPAPPLSDGPQAVPSHGYATRCARRPAAGGGALGGVGWRGDRHMRSCREMARHSARPAPRPRPRFCCGRLPRARMCYDGTVDVRGGVLVWWRTSRVWGVPRVAAAPSPVIAALMALYLGVMAGSHLEGPSAGNALGSRSERWGGERCGLACSPLSTRRAMGRGESTATSCRATAGTWPRSSPASSAGSAGPAFSAIATRAGTTSARAWRSGPTHMTP